jgi:transposase
MMKKAVESRRWFMRWLVKKKRQIVVLKRLKGRAEMEKTEKPKVERPGIEEKRRQKVLEYTAQQKCRAVLSVWTERRKPGEVCRELGVGWSLLNQWQERAMGGMLMALGPRISVMENKVALNSRLAVLLERKSRGGVMKGLERRLAKLQGNPAKQPGKLRETGAEKLVRLDTEKIWRSLGGIPVEQKERRHKRGLLEENQKLARERALVILQVRSGLLTAKEGARLLGVSRKTYYEWEEKSLKAMALALENHPAGRPPVPVDEEKETLRDRIQELEKKLYLAEKTIEVKEMLAVYDTFRDKGAKKNRLIGKRR